MGWWQRLTGVESLRREISASGEVEQALERANRAEHDLGLAQAKIRDFEAQLGTLDGPPVRCPNCHKAEHVTQQVISRFQGSIPRPVGALVRCLGCRKAFSIVDGKAEVPSWVIEAEKLEAEQRAALEQQREKMRGKPNVDPDLRW